MRYMLSLVGIVASLALFAAEAPAQQTSRPLPPILFDESGRQIDPDRIGRGPVAGPRQPTFGRVPIDSKMSLGFETESKMKAGQQPDGRPIPGIDPMRRHENPSFFGLSISAPTR